jgi:hypothetical protein
MGVAKMEIKAASVEFGIQINPGIFRCEEERSAGSQSGGADAAGDTGGNQTGSGDQSGQGEKVAAFHGEFGRDRKYELRGGTMAG